MTHARKPYSRWKADTETAFVLALRLHGKVREAAGTCGVSLAAAYQRRRRNPAFACNWDEAVAEHRVAWEREHGSPQAPEPSARRRFDGLTPVRRRAFLRALGETGDVTEACERVRITAATAYRERRQDPGFARGWEAALHRSAPILEQIAWERAVEGWEEPVYHGGALVGTRRRYSDTLLSALLRREGVKVDPKLAKAGPKELQRIAAEAARAAGGLFTANPRATEEDTNRAIMKQLAVLDKRIEATRQKAIAEGRDPDEAVAEENERARPSPVERQAAERNARGRRRRTVWG